MKLVYSIDSYSSRRCISTHDLTLDCVFFIPPDLHVMSPKTRVFNLFQAKDTQVCKGQLEVGKIFFKA